MFPRPPTSTLFPYTTLFRSDLIDRGWQLYNYQERLAFSATPPDFGALIVQRRRWANGRSEEHTSELQSHSDLVCRLLLEKKNNNNTLFFTENIYFSTNVVFR